MDIRQLEAFVYTVKYQSFSLAAQKLYLSQPTVSSHINNLEKELHNKITVVCKLSLKPLHTLYLFLVFSFSPMSSCKTPTQLRS